MIWVSENTQIKHTKLCFFFHQGFAPYLTWKLNMLPRTRRCIWVGSFATGKRHRRGRGSNNGMGGRGRQRGETCNCVQSRNKQLVPKSCFMCLLSPWKRGNMFSPALVCLCVCVCDHDNWNDCGLICTKFYAKVPRGTGRLSLCFVMIGRGMWK